VARASGTLVKQSSIVSQRTGSSRRGTCRRVCGHPRDRIKDDLQRVVRHVRVPAPEIGSNDPLQPSGRRGGKVGGRCRAVALRGEPDPAPYLWWSSTTTKTPSAPSPIASRSLRCTEPFCRLASMAGDATSAHPKRRAVRRRAKRERSSPIRARLDSRSAAVLAATAASLVVSEDS
jgi:hypothetical protein